ncbi:MAG: HNH endonuclease signature motif containing protein [Nanobdellota archaeon]
MNKKTYKDKNGYLRFSDSNMLVHRWKATKKYGKEKINGKEIHHLDGNKENNNFDNLVIVEKQDHYNIGTNTIYNNKKIKLWAYYGLWGILISQIYNIFAYNKWGIVTLPLIIIILIRGIKNGKTNKNKRQNRKINETRS